MSGDPIHTGLPPASPLDAPRCGWCDIALEKGEDGDLCETCQEEERLEKLAEADEDLE